MNRRLLGKDHPDIAMNLSNLAFVLYRQGKREAAMDMLRDALEMRRRTLGSDHPDVAASATSLAYWLTDAGRYEEASALVEESLAIREKALGREHPQFAGTLTVKANLMLATRRYQEARETRDRGPQHPQAEPTGRPLAGGRGAQHRGRRAREARRLRRRRAVARREPSRPRRFADPGPARSRAQAPPRTLPRVGPAGGSCPLPLALNEAPPRADYHSFGRSAWLRSSWQGSSMRAARPGA